MTLYKAMFSVMLGVAALGLATTQSAAHPLRNPLADPLKLALSTADQARDLQTDLYIVGQRPPYRRDAGPGDKLYWGNRNRREIAVTFDDGPHPQYVPTILSILAKHHVRATFFVIGEMAERYPEMVLKEAAAGHEVSNHTFHHARLSKVVPELAGPEIEACDVILEQILRRPADRYFRPPGGDINGAVEEACRQLGKTPVMYTDDPQDYKNLGGKVLLDRLLKAAAPGGIILLHDNVKQTIHILPALLTALEKQGYRFVTVAQLDADRTGGSGTGQRRPATLVAGSPASRRLSETIAMRSRAYLLRVKGTRP